jgi:hypothetical protein
MNNTYQHIIPKRQDSNCIWNRRRLFNYTRELHFALFIPLHLPNGMSVALHGPQWRSYLTENSDNVPSNAKHPVESPVLFATPHAPINAHTPALILFTHSTVSR